MTGTLVESRPMARKKTEAKPPTEAAKIEADVMRDARIVVALSGEELQAYLSRVLRPLVAKDKDDALKREQGGKPKR